VCAPICAHPQTTGGIGAPRTPRDCTAAALKLDMAAEEAQKLQVGCCDRVARARGARAWQPRHAAVLRTRCCTQTHWLGPLPVAGTMCAGSTHAPGTLAQALLSQLAESRGESGGAAQAAPDSVAATLRVVSALQVRGGWLGLQRVARHACCCRRTCPRTLATPRPRTRVSRTTQHNTSRLVTLRHVTSRHTHV
jgi:hypothetical protein